MVKRFFAFLLLILFLAVPGSVQAQNEIELSKMVINIWPEYDQPGVLVFYRLTLASQTSLPAALSLRIPKAAEKPFNVAMKDVDGRLDNLHYSSITEGNWIKVSFTTPVPEVQFEYYDPAILVTDKLHEFEYSWPGDYSIESLVLTIQQPLSAERFLIRPAMGSGQVSQDGFTYFESVVGEVKAGVTFNIHLEYEKNGLDLSAPSQAVAPVEPINTSTLGWQTLNEVLPLFLSGLGLFLIIAGIYWYWRSGKTITMAFRRRYSLTRSKEADTEPLEVFCHSCGRKAMSGDIYCRSCGTKIRTE
jgi:hypothetical protein